MKKILYIGSLGKGDTCHERMKALEELGHSVVPVNIVRPLGFLMKTFARLGRVVGLHFDFAGLNRDIRARVGIQPFDLVWVDKGTTVKADTLRYIKQLQPACILVHLNPDDPFGEYRRGWGSFLTAIPEYDIHFVARTQNVEEFARLGGKKIFVFDRSFSKKLHRPMVLAPEEEVKYRVPVGFIGAHAHARASMIAHLIQNGIPVAVYGNGWPGQSYWDTVRPHYRGPSRYGEEYTKTINGMGIALHFLRHENRDEQDSRTFEIPACGAFMLAERSRKHEQFFRENEEAVFFDTAEELLEKVHYYLTRPEEAARIAAAGRQRCVESGYDHHTRMNGLLALVESKSNIAIPY